MYICIQMHTCVFAYRLVQFVDKKVYVNKDRERSILLLNSVSIVQCISLQIIFKVNQGY